MDLKATVHKKGRNLTILIVATWSRVIWMSIYRQRKHCKHGKHLSFLLIHAHLVSHPRLNKTSTAAKKRVFLKHFLHCDSKTAFAHRSHLSKGHIEIKIIKRWPRSLLLWRAMEHIEQNVHAHTPNQAPSRSQIHHAFITSSLAVHNGPSETAFRPPLAQWHVCPVIRKRAGAAVFERAVSQHLCSLAPTPLKRSRDWCTMRVEPFPFSHGSLALQLKKPSRIIKWTWLHSAQAVHRLWWQIRRDKDEMWLRLHCGPGWLLQSSGDATRPQRCHSESAPLHFPSLKFQSTPSPANQYCHLGHRGILACFFMPRCRREQLIVLKSYKPKQPSLTRSRFLIRAGAITLMPPKVPRKPPINLDVKLVNKELK